MGKIKTIAVFCGSSSGNAPEFEESARLLGKCIAEKNIGMVYGGGAIGLMGTCAKSCVENGGKVDGVIPQFLCDIPRVKAGAVESSLTVTKDMHERKKKMCSMADAFIALPGGIGTFEEIFEQMAWLQLRLHNKPCAFLNTNGFYDKLIDFLHDCVTSGFIKNDVFSCILCDENPNVLIDKIIHSEIKLNPKV